MLRLPNKYRQVRAATVLPNKKRKRTTRKRAGVLLEPDAPFKCSWCSELHVPWRAEGASELLIFFMCCRRTQVGRIGDTDYTKFPPVGWNQEGQWWKT